MHVLPRSLLVSLSIAAASACSSSSDTDAAQPPSPSADAAAPEAVPLLLVDQARRLLPSTLPVEGLHAAVADLDADGKPDIAQPTDVGLRVYWNEGEGAFQAASTAALPAVAAEAKFVLAGDFDGDGMNDLLAVDDGDEPVRLLSHANPRTFVAKGVETQAGAEIRHGVAADLEGDGDLDVVFTLSGTPSSPGAVHALVLVNDGAGKLTDQTTSRLAAPGLMAFGVAAGDVDGDGSVDLLFTGDVVPHRLLLNDGTGRFRDAPPDALPVTDAPDGRIPALGDLDGDGSLDVVISSGTANQIFVNDGTGRFADETPFMLGSQPGTGRVAAIADFDRDTHADVVIGGAASPFRILRNDGTGRFFDYSSSMVPHGPADSDAVSISVADIDGDGDPDAFVSRGNLACPWLLVNWYPEDVADDDDGDEVPDGIDNCPDTPNPDQANRDAQHFSCSSGTDCAKQTGCTLALRDGGSAYLLCDTPRAWPDARAFCRARGADLVVVDDNAENDFLAESGLPTMWMGLSDTQTEGTFLWVDGTAPSTTHWKVDEPNDHGEGEDCGGMYTSGEDVGKWNDFDCSSEKAFVCEDELLRSPEDPGDACDVCPGIHDPDQKDSDDDGVGDACSTEST